MVLTNAGRNLIRDDLDNLLSTGGLGLDDTDPQRTDDELLGGGTTVDACDAATGWSAGGTGSSVSLNTTSGEFQEGSGCLNLPASAGVAYWEKTVTSFDAQNGFVVLWLYLDNAADVNTGADSVTVTLGTGGVTNSNDYEFDQSTLSNGWNSLILDLTASADMVNGTGADETSVDTIRLTTDLAFNQNSNDMRMDYWRYYEPDTLGISDSNKSLDNTKGDFYVKTNHQIDFSESNGLDITEAGDSDGSTLINRFTFAIYRKAENVQSTIEKYYYIDQE